MNRSPRYATVALLSAVFAIMAAGPSSAQDYSSNASNSAVRSAVTDARGGVPAPMALQRRVARTTSTPPPLAH